MVAGKVKMAIGIQKSPSPATPKTALPKPNPKESRKPQTLPSPSSAKSTSRSGTNGNQAQPHPPPPTAKTAFARSFGVYFPRSSAQVQPKPPDVAELLRVVEQLRDRESRLKTELLELKLVRESAALVPVLESEIEKKESEIENRDRTIEDLKSENERLRVELNDTKRKLEESQSRGRELLRTTSLREDELTASQRFQGLIDATVKSNLIKNVRKGAATKTNDVVLAQRSWSVKRDEAEGCYKAEEMVEVCESVMSESVRSRAPRVPKPPPKRDLAVTASSEDLKENRAPPPPPPLPAFAPAANSKTTPLMVSPPPVSNTQVQSKVLPPPPPPPPPRPSARPATAKVRRVPEVVEFYHSLMRRDSRRETGGGVGEAPATTASSCARDMIGEIENRSAYLLAIKNDVETQGDFIRFLIKEVENATFSRIEDVVPFVKWLDDELSFLVDERAVLKHFDWPEQKADALREAAFGYSDLKKLELEASSFQDDRRQAFPYALKKMQTLYDKLEHGIYNLSRLRESATNRYKLHHIPVDWMLETGLPNQIKLASVKLAMKYMQRVSAELEHVDNSVEEEELIVQGVRFAFRVHQFAGGFDSETMKAFSELREKARTCHRHQQEQQRFLCRSTTLPG